MVAVLVDVTAVTLSTLRHQPHTYGPDCPLCGDGRSGTRCDHYEYSSRRVRFLLAHRDSFDAAYLTPDKRSASNELERLNREYATLPPRHDCSCRCPNQLHGRMRCGESKRLDAERPQGPDVAISIGRTSMVNAPTPSPELLDLERAIAVVGPDDARAIARYMSLNGTSMAPLNAPLPVELPPLSTIVETLPTPIGDTRTFDCLGYQLGGAEFCVHLAA